MSDMKVVLAVVSLCALVAAAPARAQSAAIQVLHNDPDGIVEPGQTIRVTIGLTWSEGWTLGSLAGDAVVTSDLGNASNPRHGFAPAFGGAFAISGQATFGSIRGYVASISPGSTLFPASFTSGWSGIDALTYDWTAPSAAYAGNFTFEFSYLAGAPGVYLYPGAWPWAGAPLPAPTTITPATVTLIPAPASPAALVAASTCVWRRRR